MDIAGKILVGVLCAVWIALPIHYNVMKHLARKRSIDSRSTGSSKEFAGLRINGARTASYAVSPVHRNERQTYKSEPH